MNATEYVKVESLVIHARQRDLALAPLLAKEDLLLTDERRWQIMAEALEAFADSLWQASADQIAKELGMHPPVTLAGMVKMTSQLAVLTAQRLRDKS